MRKRRRDHPMIGSSLRCVSGGGRDGLQPWRGLRDAHSRLLAAGGIVDRGLDALAEVLARTQRDMLRTPAWASPFYWAGFRLTGSGRDGARSALAVRY